MAECTGPSEGRKTEFYLAVTGGSEVTTNVWGRSRVAQNESAVCVCAATRLAIQKDFAHGYIPLASCAIGNWSCSQKKTAVHNAEPFLNVHIGLADRTIGCIV